jgi:phospholipid/cholesterol/gamma-HCH transport system permease protein
MLSALVVVARSSSAIASELAVMHLHGEFTALRRMGVPAASFLFVPRIAALTLSLPALTAIFQGVSGFSGCMGYALWQQQPLDQTVGNFLEFSDAWLFLASLLKSALTGFVVGTIACYHGSSEPRSAQAISDAAVHAVGSGLVAVFVIDMAFAAGAMGLT